VAGASEGGFEVGGVLDGADFDVGFCAVFVEAVAGDPDLAFAEHGSLGVDEEGLVLLLEDDVGDVGCDDAVVVFDELFLIFDREGMLAGVDLDGIVDERGDAGGVVVGDGSLEIGEELVDFDVVADGLVDGLVELGGAGLGAAGCGCEERDYEEGEACEYGAGGHSISKRGQRIGVEHRLHVFGEDGEGVV
jgi:hypothetical protein